MKRAQVTLFIGHRGVGKTSLLKRVEGYFKQQNKKAQFIDLDAYVASKACKSILEIFKNEGEGPFRKYEREALQELLTAHESLPLFVSLGAGFQGPYPEGARIVFVQRVSDAKGRVFLDRPRLKKDISPLQEFSELYQKRHQVYLSVCTDQLVLPEGQKENPAFEMCFFGLTKNSHPLGGCLTLTPQKQKEWKRRALNSKQTPILSNQYTGVSKIEIRTDHWPEASLNSLLKCLSPDKILFAHRNLHRKAPDGVMTDWALELGPPSSFFDILSLHKREEDLNKSFQAWSSYEKQADHFKLAVPIKNFKELQQGHAWYLQNPKKHCFLPMSKDGRWAWYRLWHKNKMFPNFFKEGLLGSALDQPLYFQWYDFFPAKHFAAILGQPVSHSRTPNEQKEFFNKKNMPVLNIPMSLEECTKDHLVFLAQLGLRAAAVTSPLKLKMSELMHSSEKSVNTIFFNESQNSWLSTNTDSYGFSEQMKLCRFSEGLVVWGGRGVLSSLAQALPTTTSFYSATTGTPRVSSLPVKNPKVVIWAVGRDHSFQWPPSSWAPQQIIDLNYSEDSPGREYAQHIGCEYISGETMFYQQAKQQRVFWSECWTQN